MSLPYANIVEPFIVSIGRMLPSALINHFLIISNHFLIISPITFLIIVELSLCRVQCYFDSVGQRQRLDYYNGLDVYIYRADTNVQWSVSVDRVSSTCSCSPCGCACRQVSPVLTQQMCFQTNGTVDLTSMLPDLSTFTLQSAPVVIRGVSCQNWQLITKLGSRFNTCAPSAPLQMSDAHPAARLLLQTISTLMHRTRFPVSTLAQACFACVLLEELTVLAVCSPLQCNTT
jgi:hypothetical protein